MNLLAIDCASSILSIAVSRGEEILCTETEAGMRHSELVMDLIDSLMKKVALMPKDLNGVLCMGGPGSFTGLRIGYSIAKGFALSLGIPFASVPTLDCIALSVKKSGFVIATIKARKNAFFYSIYKDGECVKDAREGETAQITQEIERLNQEAGEITLAGPGGASLYETFSQKLKNCICVEFENRGYGKAIISIAKNKKILDNDNNAYLYSGPEYIRKTDAELNLQGNAEFV